MAVVPSEPWVGGGRWVVEIGGGDEDESATRRHEDVAETAIVAAKDEEGGWRGGILPERMKNGGMGRLTEEEEDKRHERWLGRREELARGPGRHRHRHQCGCGRRRVWTCGVAAAARDMVGVGWVYICSEGVMCVVGSRSNWYKK